MGLSSLWLVGVVGGILLIMWMETQGYESSWLYDLVVTVIAGFFLVTAMMLFLPPMISLIISILGRFEWGRKILRANPYINTSDEKL